MAIDDFDLDLATADAVIALVDPQLRAEAITRLRGGANSAVFEVRTNGAAPLVVKVYSDVFHWKMEKEVFVYGLLKDRVLAAPVPEVLAADDSKTLMTQNVLVMTKLDGKTALALVEGLEDSELAHINRQVGAFLRSLHEVSFDQFGYIGTDGILGPHITNLAYMRSQFNRKLTQFAELGGDQELRQAIERYVAAREELFADCARAVYCHNDCHYGNVLVLPDRDGWRMSGMLDFENVLSGDPLLDLAKAHCYARRRSETLLAALIDGYGDVRSGWRETLDLYILYHWLELWDWFAASGFTDWLDQLADEMRLLAAEQTAPHRLELARDVVEAERELVSRWHPGTVPPGEYRFCDALTQETDWDTGKARRCQRPAHATYGELAVCWQHEQFVAEHVPWRERTVPSNIRQTRLLYGASDLLQAWLDAKIERGFSGRDK